MEEVLPYIFCTMRSPDQGGMLADCSILLCSILEVDNPPIQRVIDSGVVPRLAEIMKSTEDHTVQANLARVVINLASGTSKQKGVLVQETGFLSALVTLVESPDDYIANKAISAVGTIANSTPEYHRLVLQAGTVKPLLRLLRHSSNVDTSKIASWTFAICCRGNHPDFALTLASLKILTRLLVYNDNEVVRNSCWALFHLLDGLKYEEINDVINMGFFKHLLKLVAKAPLDVKETALKSIYRITSAGDACVQSITNHNGITCIMKSLSSPHGNIQKLACCAISNIISDNTDRIQVAIDSNVLPCLVQIMASESDKKHLPCLLFTRQQKGGTRKSSIW